MRIKASVTLQEPQSSISSDVGQNQSILGPTGVQASMKIIGIILIVIGIILFFVYSNLKRKLASLRQARPASIAELNHLASEIALEMGSGSWRDYVKLRGTIQCDQPLISELKQMPCVHYNMTVVREYEEQVTERDSDDKVVTKTQRGSETLSQNRESVPSFAR